MSHSTDRTDSEVDTASSASRQHYIDTGRYLTEAETAAGPAGPDLTDEDAPAPWCDGCGHPLSPEGRCEVAGCREAAGPAGLSPAQRKLAAYVEQAARDHPGGMEPGAALAALRKGHDGEDASAVFAESWGLTVADLDGLAAAFVRADGFELIDEMRTADELETAALVGELAPDVESDPPVTGTLSDVVRALADALEVLPTPLRWEWARYSSPPCVEVHVSGDLAKLEEWRAWWGAPPVRATPWQRGEGGGWWRTHSTTVERHGQRIHLFTGEHRSRPESPAEKRERLAAELAAIDGEIAAGGGSDG